MILFGHAGFGDAMAGRLRGDLPRRWVLPGTLLRWEDEGRGHGSQGGKPANDPRLADVELVGLHAAHEQEEDFVSYQFGTTLTFQF